MYRYADIEEIHKILDNAINERDIDPHIYTILRSLINKVEELEDRLVCHIYDM